MERENNILFDGRPLIGYGDDRMDAEYFINVGVNMLRDSCEYSEEEIDCVIKNAKDKNKMHESDYLKWDNEDPKFIEAVYDATETYLDGMMCLWDGAGDGVYKASDNARAIREKLEAIYHLIYLHRHNIRYAYPKKMFTDEIAGAMDKFMDFTNYTTEKDLVSCLEELRQLVNTMLDCMEEDDAE